MPVKKLIKPTIGTEVNLLDLSTVERIIDSSSKVKIINVKIEFTVKLIENEYIERSKSGDVLSAYSALNNDRKKTIDTPAKVEYIQR